LVSPHTIYVAYAVVEINRSIVIPLIVRVMEASCKDMSVFDTDILG
jgi:hypothetical protein